MSKIRDHVKTLERRQHYLERRLRNLGLLYSGRDYDRAEYAALTEAIKLLREKKSVFEEKMVKRPRRDRRDEN